ncbi:metal-dependent protein hydrolase [Neoconidiobolus thromboides FSU 785]|nr:metal-dependent protein hydrolase [Neoconidiobolus thromboides FSU 785]
MFKLLRSIPLKLDPTKFIKPRYFISTIKTNMVKIGTHNGTFHCDEALAVYMLKQLPEYKQAEVVRSRDPKVLEQCDVVVDVGGVYDASTHRYDHHQREFKDTFSSDYTTRLSSAGLVYKHFGKRIISQTLDLDINDSKVELLFQKIYENFVHALDAIDNGVEKYETTLTPRYYESTNLPSRVGHLLPYWNQPQTDLDQRFVSATELAGSEFIDRVKYYGLAWLPGRDIVLEAINKRFDYHDSGKIVVFEDYCPWKDHVFTLEKELNLGDQLTYVIYHDEIGSSYRVQCIPVQQGSFQSRLPLPEEWRGVRDDDLSAKSDIPQCIFVHASGFIGGNKTKQGALNMAIHALKLANTDNEESKKPKLE